MVIPLGVCNLTVTVLVAEAGKELDEYLVGSHVTGHHLRVARSIINHLQVCRSNNVVAVRVELVKGLVNHVLSHLIRLSAHAEKEFIVGDVTVFVEVEEFHKDARLLLAKFAAHILEPPVQLLLVQLTVATVVHNAESATN